MTASICWERSVGPLSELVFASDSRLSGGESWDACPKLFNIGRSDVVMAFAGDTHRAYPFILQAISTVGSYRGSERQSLDVTQLAGHLVKAMDQMLSMAKESKIDGPPGCEFILGGWSWRLGRFRAYRIFYEPTVRRFTSVPGRKAPEAIGGEDATGLYIAIGDAGPRATSLMAEGRRGARVPLDMDPVEIIASMSEGAEYRTVGGSPQVMKVYRHMSVESFAVKWTDGVSIGGRPLLPHENHDLRIMARDPDRRWSIMAEVAKEQASSQLDERL